jgi:hypothetical protein
MAELQGYSALAEKVKTGEIIIKQGQGEEWLDSRKFRATLIAASQGLVTKDNFSGVLTAISGVIGGYVVGQGYADGQATNINRANPFIF